MPKFYWKEGGFLPISSPLAPTAPPDTHAGGPTENELLEKTHLGCFDVGWNVSTAGKAFSPGTAL